VKSFVEELPARTAKLAIVRADGSPHVAAVWAARYMGADRAVAD